MSYLLLLAFFYAVCARAEAAGSNAAGTAHSGSAHHARKLPVTSPVSLDWAGRSWSVKTGVALPGAGAGSHYEPSHVWVDAAGALVLKVAPRLGVADCSAWSSAEVWTNAPLGYGTYEFQVTAPRFLDPFTTFGCGSRSAPRALPSAPPRLAPSHPRALSPPARPAPPAPKNFYLGR